MTGDRPRKNPLWANGFVLACLAALVLGGAGVGAFYLLRYSAGEYENSLFAADLLNDLHRANEAGWTFVLVLRPSPADANAPNYNPQWLVEDLNADLREVRARAPHAPASLRPEIERYTALLQRAAASVYARDEVAYYAAMNESRPVLQSLARKLDDIVDKESDEAAAAKTSTAVASAALLFGAAVVVGVLFAGFERTRRRSAALEAEREVLQRSEARFRALIEHSSDVIFVLGQDHTVQFLSPSAGRILGLVPEEVQGNPVESLFAEDEVAPARAFLDEVSSRPGYTATTELCVKDPRGRDRYFEVVCTNLLHQEDVQAIVANARDVTQRHRMEAQLREQAFHDSLTGLANRALFLERLEDAISRDRGKEAPANIGVLYLDLDNFKTVNDDLGHSLGDEVLREVAQRLKATVSAADTVARLGGDEFAVILRDVPSIEEVKEVGARILEVIAAPVLLGATEVALTASIGVVVADPCAVIAEQVIRDADVAMYDAKNDGRACLRVFESRSSRKIVERLRLTNEMQGALHNGELFLSYQPLVALDGEKLVGFEALMRWRHPRRGLLLPSEFISLAEDTGLIFSLGEWALGAALAQLRRWLDRYPELGDLSMSVNISVKQLHRPGFVEMVQELLAASGVKASSLILEVTESVLIPNLDQAMARIQQLRAIGVRVALDDFGTGYSSLGYLRQLPVDILKIDQGFVQGLDRDDKDRALAETVIDLGRLLGIDVIAEGIERQKQLDVLARLGCDYGQGFLFGAALEPQAVERFLQEMKAAGNGTRLPRVA